MSTLPQFGWTPNKFTLHNAAPKPVVIRWAGLQFTLPPRDGVVKFSAKYEDGTPIPGTLVLQDSYSPDRDGRIPNPDEPPNWSAFEAIRNVLGIDPSTKEAISPFAKAGISFLPTNPTKDVVDNVVADGRRRYEEHRVEWAEQTVAGYLDAVQKAREANVPPPPDTRDYNIAREILAKYHKQEQLATLDDAASNDEAEMQAFIEAEAMTMAKRASKDKDIDETELARKLLENPVVRKNLQRNFRIRKVGHLDVPTGPEEAA